MAFNQFVIKKYVALILPQLLTVILFYVGTMFYDIWWGLGFMFIGLILGIILGNAFLSNPFSQMLEGKGLMCFNIDSTGVIRPFLIGLQNPYIRGKLNKQPINDVFDRATVYSLATPVANKTLAQPIIEGDKAGGIKIELDERDFNNARFGFFHYPVLIWNDQIKSIVTKEFLSNQEKDTFAEHGVLYLNRKMEELTSAVRDFGRYIVELTRPKKGFFENWWAWVLIGGFILLLALMFGPAILQAMQNVGGTIGATANTASNSVITPR